MTEKFNTIIVNIDGRGVARVALNRVDVRNAMNEEMIAELTCVAQMLAARKDVRVVVLTGSGYDGVFCAGGDLRWMQGNMGKPYEEMVAQSQSLATMLASIDTLPQLVIGRINGSAFGGGIGLISVCDISFGLTTSRYCLTEVTLGLLPANIGPFVVRRMGESASRRALLNATIMTGKEAVKLNLLTQAVEPEVLDDMVNAEIKRVMRCAPGAVASTKALIRHITTHDQSTSRQYAAEALAAAWASEEGQVGVKCFFDKSPPPWKIDTEKSG